MKFHQVMWEFHGRQARITSKIHNGWSVRRFVQPILRAGEKPQDLPPLARDLPAGMPL